MRKGVPKREIGLAKVKILEAEFQCTVIEAAKTYGWACFYIPDSERSGKVQRPHGWPDLTLAHPVMCILLFVECKTDATASKPSEDQIKWLTILDTCGATVQLWRPSMWDHIEKVLAGPAKRTWDALDNTEGIGRFAPLSRFVPGG